MKLQTKINYRFLVLLLMVFLFAGGILYFVLGLVVNDNLDENLKEKGDKVIKSIGDTSLLSGVAESPDQTIRIKAVNRSHIRRSFSDTVVYDTHEKEAVNFRRMTFDTVSQGQRYEISVLLSKLETKDLVGLIFYFMLGLFALIVLLLYFLNNWLSSAVWRPFYKTLEQLNTFRIGQKNDITLIESNVYEFGQLNSSLMEMVQKAQSDFRNLKEFTENASHEIQTPIAVIKSKLESLLQDKTLSDQRYEQIQSAYGSVNRLSKLNEALLLLSKIENQQFPNETDTDLCELVRQRLELIEELIEFKRIEVVLTIPLPLVVKINPFLAEILINNLLGNAVKHNVEDGRIVISSSSGQLIISNTGKPLTIAPEKLFQRFAKHNAGNESTGLGLAIASQICIKSRLSLTYNYHHGYHSIRISQNS
jgi:signal transduction histidine kinase